MIRLAQFFAAILALLLGAISLGYLLNPEGIATANHLSAISDFGLTNTRAQAAPILMIAVMSAIGAVRKEWLYLVPAALYFLFTALIRILGLVLDGTDPSTVRGLGIAVVFFLIAEGAVLIFRKSKVENASS